MSKETMKLALEALKANVIGTSGRMPKTHEAITALQEALAEQPAQQEPCTRVECMGSNGCIGYCWNKKPAQRTWVELTDEEFDEATAYANPHCDEWAFAKAIEAILREKNS